MIGGQLTTGVETMASKMMASIQALPLVNQSLDLVQKSIHLLMDQSVCPRCTLRYLGIRDRGIHESINQTLTMKAEPAPQLVDSVIPSKRDHSETEDLVLEYKENHKVGEHCLGSSSSKSPCSVCLGMMNMDFKEMAVKAHEKASQFSVVDKTFYLSMRMPPQLTIRHRSISVYLKEELSKTNAYWSLPDPIELKEIFRHLVAKSYADHSGFEFTTESNLCLNVHVDHAETERDYMFLKDIPEANFKIRLLRKKGKEVVEGASMEKIQKAVGRLEFQQLHQAGQTPPPLITSEPKLKDLHFTHEPIFIAGRYNKWQRHISNTPWEIHGKRLAEHSVEELIAEHTDKIFQAESHKFSSAGREDSDVLMLGRGRPFYMEVINPRNASVSNDDLRAVQAQIMKESGGKVGVVDLQIVSRDSTKVLKDSAATKSKSYTCLVKLAKPVSLEAIAKLSGSENIQVKQRNPTRVPRRADLVRDKVIESITIRPESLLSPELTETDLLRVDLKTSAGTYVKEFVHGDDGRTVPCLATLFEVEAAQCVELDVLEVHLDWPPALDTN